MPLSALHKHPASATPGSDRWTAFAGFTIHRRLGASAQSCWYGASCCGRWGSRGLRCRGGGAWRWVKRVARKYCTRREDSVESNGKDYLQGDVRVLFMVKTPNGGDDFGPRSETTGGQLWSGHLLAAPVLKMRRTLQPGATAPEAPLPTATALSLQPTSAGCRRCPKWPAPGQSLKVPFE
ncbi:hypothetical protein G7046_g3734 [Stylonectria norvegica]|nr:hypothetical protein G7046_g3734 [Stylonectria norvegica]